MCDKVELTLTKGNKNYQRGSWVSFWDMLNNQTGRVIIVTNHNRNEMTQRSRSKGLGHIDT